MDSRPCFRVGAIQKYVHPSDVPVNKARFFQSCLSGGKVCTAQNYVNILCCTDGGHINPRNPGSDRISTGNGI